MIYSFISQRCIIFSLIITLWLLLFLPLWFKGDHQDKGVHIRTFHQNFVFHSFHASHRRGEMRLRKVLLLYQSCLAQGSFLTSMPFGEEKSRKRVLGQCSVFHLYFWHNARRKAYVMEPIPPVWINHFQRMVWRMLQQFHFIKKVQTNAHDEHALVIRILINERSAGLMTCLNLIRENSCITHMAFSEVNNFIRLTKKKNCSTKY